MWGKTLRHLLPSTFLSCSGLMCLKSNAQLGLQSSESESTNHHLWILIMPACQHKDPLHFIHILKMLCQGLSATYFQAHKAWMSTNVWAEQHLLALFGERLLYLVVPGSVTSMRSIVAVVIYFIISQIIQNNGANLAHRCRLLALLNVYWDRSGSAAHLVITTIVCPPPSLRRRALDVWR